MRIVKLADCCSFFTGGTPTKSKTEYWKGEIPWFSPKDIKRFDLVASQDHISECAVRESATRLIEPGTILVVGRMLARTLPVGIVRQPSAFNQDIKAIVPNDKFDSEFVTLFLMANQSHVLKHGVKTGPTVNSLISGFIENLEIPLLSLGTQRQIANRLKNQLAEAETARHAIEKQRAELHLLKRKSLEAVFNNIENRQPIGSVSKVQSGYAFKSASFTQTGVKLLRNTNILPGKVYWDATVCLNEADAQQYPHYALAEGDVLISLDRPIISSGIKVARVSEKDLPALLLQRVGRFQINPNLLDPDYLYAFLQTDLFISEISGHEHSIGVPHVSPAQIEAIEIPLPDLSTQKLLAKKLSEIIDTWSTAIKAVELQLKDLAALPQRTLAQAFEPQVNDHA